jgi:hypothetical protein
VPTTPTAQAALSDAAGGVAEVAETMIKAAMDPNWCFLEEDGTSMPLRSYPVNRVLATGERLVDTQTITMDGPQWPLNLHAVQSEINDPF